LLLTDNWGYAGFAFAIGIQAGSLPARDTRAMFVNFIILLFVLLGVTSAATYLCTLFFRKGAFFEVNGVRLHYVEAGQGTPVILVHGLACDHVPNWRLPRIFQRLSRRYRVIALDLRGHGKSDKPHDPAQYGLELVEDIVRLMDHLGIGKAHVVGYSLGGFITLKLALRHPDRLLSAAPCGAGWSANPAEELKLLFSLSEDVDQGRGLTVLLNWLQALKKPLPAPVLWFMHRLTSLFNDMKAISCLLRNTPALVATEAEVRGNVVPCLAIVGGDDRMRLFAEQMASAMPNLELLILPGCDHFTTLLSRKMVPALMAFLDRHTP
jgi:pimeloyl-ACP methyl ester carboxylesterase